MPIKKIPQKELELKEIQINDYYDIRYDAWSYEIKLAFNRSRNDMALQIPKNAKKSQLITTLKNLIKTLEKIQ